MNTIATGYIQELEMESATTRRFLERIPADRLDWQPHEKSLSAGQLGMHIATIPGGIAEMGSVDECDPPEFGFAPPESHAALLAAHDENVARAKKTLAGINDERMPQMWNLVVDGKSVWGMPRATLFRAILFNHLYHHRGQLGVYLRMMGVDVPSAYGPSGDEVPADFQEMMDAVAAANA